MPNDIRCNSPRARLRRIGTSKIKRDGEDRDRDKQSVPAWPGFQSARLRHQGSGPDRDDPGVNRAGHPPVAIQTRSARKFLEAEDGEEASRRRSSGSRPRKTAAIPTGAMMSHER